MGDIPYTSVYKVLTRLPIVREYETAFRKATGLSLKLLPAGLRQRRMPLGARENPFCAVTARSPAGCTACLQVQAELQRRLGRKLAPQQVCCFAGLTDVAVPVVVGGQHVATLFGGQVFLRKPTGRQFARLRRQFIEWGQGKEIRRIEKAYFHTHIVSEDQFRAMVRLLNLFAGHLAAHASRSLLARRINEPPCVTEVRSFVQAHYTSEPLTMRHAAQHVNLSPFYFCKIFRKATGLTFTDYLARVRVEKVQCLLANPLLRMHEVADSAGFSSISQFNRVFRRYAGTSPTAYRASVHPRSKSAQRKPIRA